MVSMFSEDYNGYLGAEGFADNRIMLNHCTGDDKPIKFSGVYPHSCTHLKLCESLDIV